MITRLAGQGTLLLILAPFACAQPARQAQGSFEEFWPTFRAAVIADDMQAIAGMTSFPFRTRGPWDDDPVISHDSASFVIIFPELLLHDPGLRPEPETMLQFIERTTSVTSKDLSDDGEAARVGNFVFERVDDRWLFVMAYTDEE